MKTKAQWSKVLERCGVSPGTASRWGEAFEAVVTDKTFSSPDDLHNFLGQILHESSLLEHVAENLNYSAERLLKVWPKRFTTLELAKQYERNPPKLAEFVYSGRMGNDEPGDGARYIGRGPIMTTGKNNYRAASAYAGLDLLKFPEALADPVIGLRVAVAWWETNIPDCELTDIEKTTRRVNGGLIGLADRTTLVQLAKEALA